MQASSNLQSLFVKRLFRIPDYQRGFAWQKDQLKAFWEDLVNLQHGRSHYTGVLTLSEESEVPEESKEYWLIDTGYRLYNVVDGQQRLTTCVVFVQALADFFRLLPENIGKNSDDVYVTDNLSLAGLESAYLFEYNKRQNFRTYKFGYTEDNPSQDYLRCRILGESGGGNIQETFYTLNLGNAKKYFAEQITELHRLSGIKAISELYKKLTQSFIFNEYVIADEFDVFVSFETMNNRGKKLSDLELLKNRLIYLTTLYREDQLDKSGKKSLRDDINAAWKDVYHQLGRNKTRPLNDDDFLRAHWITYFKYSRDTGRDYARFLLDDHFTPQRVQELVEKDVALDQIEEQRSEEATDQDESDIEVADSSVGPTSKLSHTEIKGFVTSLKDSISHWFDSFYPELAKEMSQRERQALDRLNRIQISYFRPLVMVILKKEVPEEKRIFIFNKIERFLFLAFRLGNYKSNYRSSEFYNLARAFDRDETTLDEISTRLEKNLENSFNKEDGTLRIDDFYSTLFKKFADGSGYYGWSGIRYVLYEYEQQLLEGSRQAKVNWADILKSEKDRISIEHVYPQTPKDDWEEQFAGVQQEDRVRYGGTIGNLLLLSSSVNSSLQNDAFIEKKNPKFDAQGRKVRNGYSDGSHSEIEVAQMSSWGPNEIKERGIRILNFMEKRWQFTLRDDDRNKLLFLNIANHG